MRVALPTDRVFRLGVAWLMTLVACGPTSRPEGPGVTPEAVGRPMGPGPGVGTVNQVMLGQMCPQGAGGRPAVNPIAMRVIAWTDASTDLANAVERGAVQRFAVYGTDGKTAGVFDTMGLADIAPGVSVASGAYVGAGPCTSDGGASGRVDTPACGPTASGCGIAAGVVGRADDPAELPVIGVSGVCLQGDSLAVDIDSDGALELFALEALLDGDRGPAKEWSARAEVGAECTPSFTQFGIPLAPAVGISLDVLGVLDLDSDGRMEIVVQLTFPTAKTIAIYAAPSSAQRLELAGEGQAF